MQKLVIEFNSSSFLEEKPFGLSNRQAEVVAEIVKGSCNKKISTNLDIVENTVKAHLTTIFKAVGSSTRTQVAVIIAKKYASDISVTTADQTPLTYDSLVKKLSPKQLVVLETLVERGAGDSNKAIADKMAISQNTVKAHISNIGKAIGKMNRTQLAVTYVALKEQRKIAQNEERSDIQEAREGVPAPSAVASAAPNSNFLCLRPSA